MPLKTVDDRYIDIWIDRIPGSNFIYVHDGGKNTAELFSQGIHSTDLQEDVFRALAKRHGVYFQDGRFQKPCLNDASVHSAVMSVAQCAALAMLEVVKHEPKVEEEPLSGRVGRALRDWQPPSVEIRRRHLVVGRMGVEHFFDFVSMPRTAAVARTVCIKLLPPSVGPSWQVSRYGFTVLDIEGTTEASWPRLAIISKSEEWPSRAVATIQSLSEEVILLRTGEEGRIERVLPDTMTRLTKAA